MMTPLTLEIVNRLFERNPVSRDRNEFEPRAPMTSSPSRKKVFKGRTLARLAAVQALFQAEQTGDPVSGIVLEFLHHRLKEGEYGLPQADTTFFSKLVEGSWKAHVSSDEIIQGALKTGWTLDRLESVTRAILRAALYELCETKTPPLVIIDEYLILTRNFFDEGEVSFVNGVLHTLSQKIRPPARKASEGKLP